MTKDEWNPIVAFLDEQAGQFERFTIVVPGKEVPRGLVNTVAQVNGAQPAGTQQVNLKNLTAAVNGIFKRGDLVTFAGHLKVYKVTRDANSDGGGLAAVFLNTPLLSAVADLEVVTYQNVTMKVGLSEDQFDDEWKGGLVMSGFEPPLMIEDPF